MPADSIETVIRELELQLMMPRVRNDAALAGALLADDFMEFGSSGHIYDRAGVLTALASDATPAPEIAEFQVRKLSDNVVLATYSTLRRDDDAKVIARTLRASLWRRSAGAWKLVFHQGTRAAGRSV